MYFRDFKENDRLRKFTFKPGSKTIPLSEKERWEMYEATKREIIESKPSPTEYENRIKELLDKLSL